MITQITANNANLYNARYQEVAEFFYNNQTALSAHTTGETDAYNNIWDASTPAHAALNDWQAIFTENAGKSWDELEEATQQTMIGYITGLESYFSYMKTLAANRKSRYLTRLPLDEDLFLIDANTRTIKVPTAFANAGIGVQGDNMAEVIYFKIARYYDHNDLNDMNILIQYTDVSGKESYIAKEWIRDVSSDSIIFGWPISNQATTKAGKINFSVRFYDWKDNQDTSRGLKYSLSTKTATVNVNPGLNFNLDELTIEDTNDLILDTIRNSSIDGSAVATEPVFVINLLRNPDYTDGKWTPRQIQDPTTGNTSTVYDLTLDGGNPIYMVAYSMDAGQVTYKWYKKTGEDVNGSQIAVAGGNPGLEFLEATAAADYYPGISYYKDRNSTIATGIVSLETYNEALAANDNILYFKANKYILPQTVGEYYGYATNMIQGSSEDKQSFKCYVPAPSPIVFNMPQRLYAFLGDQLSISVVAPTGTTVDSQNWVYTTDNTTIQDATNNDYTPTSVGKYALDVSRTRNGKTITSRSGDLEVLNHVALPTVQSIVTDSATTKTITVTISGGSGNTKIDLYEEAGATDTLIGTFPTGTNGVYSYPITALSARVPYYIKVTTTVSFGNEVVETATWSQFDHTDMFPFIILT